MKKLGFALVVALALPGLAFAQSGSTRTRRFREILLGRGRETGHEGLRPHGLSGEHAGALRRRDPRRTRGATESEAERHPRSPERAAGGADPRVRRYERQSRV